MASYKKVALGLSGGVDSATAALILQKQGFDVHPIFMRNWHDHDNYCTSKQDESDALSVCDMLGLSLDVVDFSETYHWWANDNDEKVIDLTADQYYSIGEKPPYESGEKKSSLGWGYRKKVDTLFKRVERTLNGSNIEQYMGEKNGK